MAYAGQEQRYYNNRMIIDACRPYDQRDTFPAVARVTEAEAKSLRDRWPELFDAQGKVRKDVRQAGKVPAEVGR